MDLNEWKQFTEKNIVTKQEAKKITEQSERAFNQSVYTEQLNPVYEWGKGPGMVRLYLRSDVEAYAEHLKKKKSNK